MRRDIDTAARVGRRHTSGRENRPFRERVGGIQSLRRSWSRLGLEQRLLRGDIKAQSRLRRARCTIRCQPLERRILRKQPSVWDREVERVGRYNGERWSEGRSGWLARRRRGVREEIVEGVRHLSSTGQDCRLTQQLLKLLLRLWNGLTGQVSDQRVSGLISELAYSRLEHLLDGD